MSKKSKYTVNRKERNEEIRNKYDKLIRVNGIQAHRAKNILAEKYRLSYYQIERIIYKT